MTDTVTIELKSMRFFANHGYHEEETRMGTEFNVDFLGLFSVKEKITALHQTIDYSEVFTLIKTAFAETEKLLETVAQKILDLVAATFPGVLRMELRITKLQPPIASFIGSVGILYTRDFR